MDLGLRDRVALVTGASSGLGLAIARELAVEGVRVAVVARRERELHEAVRRIVASGGSARAEGGRHRSGRPGAVRRAAVEAFGPVDILVANAGGPPSTTFATTTDAQHAAAIELNLMASIRLAHAAVPGARERRWGRVVFLSPMAARQPIPGLLLSNTARSGLLGFAKTSPPRSPGTTCSSTPCFPAISTRRGLPSWREARGGRGRRLARCWRSAQPGTPLGRSGDPSEMAAVVAFLVSERASFLTGTAIQVDGGQVQALD